MFNRNARNRLNTMGGIASFQNGGATRNPQLYFQPSQQGRGFANRGLALKARQQGFGALSPLEQMALKTELTMQGGKQAFPIEGMFSKKLGTGPDGSIAGDVVKGLETGVGALRDVITTGSGIVGSGIETLFTGKPGSAGLAGQLGSQKPTFNQMKQLGFGTTPPKNYDDQIMRSAREIALRPESIIEKDTDITLKEDKVPFYKDKIFRDLEKTQDAEQKKIIKAAQTDQTVAEEEKGITGDITRSDIISDDQRKKEGQLGDISPKSADEIAKVIKDGTKEEQDAELKQLMQEFTQNAPKYEGLDKGLAIAKIGFAMAAGQSPDALTNIAKALEGGADMFIKDKKDRDAFNRQVRLSALQYGLGEVSKDRAQDRLVSREIDKERRAIKYFVAGKGGVNYKGKTYAEGTDVPVQMADIYDNKAPTNILSSSTVTALASKLKSSNALFKEAIKSGTLSATEIRTNQEKYSKAITTAQKAEIGIGFAESSLVRLAEDGSKITGLNGSFRDFLKKGANALGMELKGYDDREQLRSDFRILLQKVIPTTLAESQSANSISNRDVDFLISAFFGEGALEGGVLNTGFLFGDPKIMAKRVQAAMVEMRNSQRKAFAEMKDVELLLNNTYAPGSQGTKSAIGFLAGQQQRAKEAGVLPGGTAKTKFQLQSTGDKDDKGRLIFKIG
jgi:hypothetical protein